MAVALSDDVFHLICEQLWHQRDFHTLYNCAITSRRLAVPALQELYRMHNAAPVTGGGSDEVEMSRTGGLANANVSSRVAEKEQIIRLWALLWRSIILSSLEKTYLPYCRYIQTLDLRDLVNLFEEQKFRGKIEREFFSGDLAQFKVESKTSQKPGAPKRLNIVEIIDKIGDAVTKNSPVLQEISGPISSQVLGRWVSRAPRLTTLELWHGDALSEGAEDVIRAQCPAFERLSMYEWIDDAEVDQKLGNFVNGLRHNSLKSFVVIRQANLGATTFSALASHGQSLQTLKLGGISWNALSALSMLKDCIALRTLELEWNSRSYPLGNVELDQDGVVDWLRGCTQLEDISMTNINTGDQIMAQVMFGGEFQIRQLAFHGTNISEAFFLSLLSQKRLISLEVRAPDPDRPEFMENLVDTICRLNTLRSLRLYEVSDSLNNTNIRRLAKSLPLLEDLYISGANISDQIWPDIALLGNIKTLVFSADTFFTGNRILDYVSQVGAGNKYLFLSIMNQYLEYPITEEEQAEVRKVLAERVDGKFELVYIRDPESSEEDSISD